MDARRREAGYNLSYVVRMCQFVAGSSDLQFDEISA
jgi:hypothetical protein